MRVSLQWLQDYIDLSDLSIQDISSTLTQLGLEVEGIEHKQPIQGPVVIGHIVKAEQHPNADKLRLCQVDVGESELISIVCGAPNARQGLKVVVARIGSTLPENFKIKESKIRGETSHGMLCSEKELGLSESHDGIIELTPHAPIGKSVAEYLHLNDTIIEIGLTPNRSDCLGVLGVARDLSARLQRPLKTPELHPDYYRENLHSAQHVRVSIAQKEDCKRFVALYVKNLRTVKSPNWLQQRLLSAGMRPINLIVDATNYAMLESGQPIHAYDERDLKKSFLQVRRAGEGEKLKTLDGQLRDLKVSDLVIADEDQPVGLAGVMGGENSEVKEDTQNVVIEVAHFHPTLIRKTAKRFALHTEASHRFERGIDISQLLWVAKRVAEIMYKASIELRAEGIEIPLPEISAHPVDIYAEHHVPATLTLRLDRLQKMVATPVETTEVVTILTRLGFNVSASTKEHLQVIVPTWRQDIEREVDLIEEVARIRGYDKIPFKLPRMQLDVLPEHPLISFIDENKVTLANLGLTEVITFPFMSSEEATAFGLVAEHPLAATVKLANPLVEQQRLLRSSMIPGLLRCIVENRRHGLQGAQLFEAARTFHEPRLLPSDLSPTWSHLRSQGVHIPSKAKADDRPIEHNRVAAILDQPFTMKSWNQPETQAGFFQGKAIVQRYLNSFGVQVGRYEPIVASEFPWLHPGASATLWTKEGVLLGYLGELHPRTAKTFDLDFQNTPVVFELLFESIYEAARSTKTYASSSIKFPPSVRDLALVVPTEVTYEKFEASFQNFKKRKFLRDVRLFDVYQGANIPTGKKSMAFSLLFQAEDRTLTDKEVEGELATLLEWLKSDLSAELR